ncbi:MAG: PDZ domain-containing protein, partial [Planctomycetaceae bacterium]
TVVAGSAAAEAGLQANDLVLFVNDQLIQSIRMLREELGRLEPGETLRLVVRRDNALVPVELPIPNQARPPRKRAGDAPEEADER